MNKFRFSWAALSLLAPVLIFSALFFGPAGCGGGGGGGAPLPSPTAANVQVGFVTTLTGISPSAIQSFILNVAGVRMNPLPNSKNTATPSETSGKWVVIPVPTATSTGSIPGDVPIDVVAGESQLQEFNTFGTKSGKFTTIEVVLDTTNPGFIVPLCAGGNLEGCTRFPIQLQNPNTPISFQQNPQLQTVQHSTVALPIQLNANVVSTPSGPGQPYIVSLTAAQPANNASAFASTVSGSVTGAQGNTVGQHSHLRVTAELEGTNTVVASSDVFNGKYSLFIPAAADIGTLYDFYIFGGTATISAVRGINGQPVFPNTTNAVNFTVKGGQTTGGFSGQVTDGCTNLPISGATLQVLVPQAGSTTSCSADPQSCISVATATTDSSGGYPLPGNSFNPPDFTRIPIGSPTISYTLQISAPGYDTLFMDGTATANAGSGQAAGRCSTPVASPTSTATPALGTCSFSLTTAYIQGAVNLTAAQPPGAKTTVQIFAENAGTNELASMLPTPLNIQGGSTSLGFTLNVPTHAFNNPSQPQNFDIFAEAEDLYQGGPDPFPGHTIIVQPNVSGPATACATATPGIFTETMDCVGHGSIAGTVGNSPSKPDSGTTIELLKNGVALTQSSVGPPTPAPSPAAGYSFCIPPDTYTLQRFEQGTPVGTQVPVGAMATPMATNSPCPSTCFSSGGGCPGICSGTTGPVM